MCVCVVSGRRDRSVRPWRRCANGATDLPSPPTMPNRLARSYRRSLFVVCPFSYVRVTVASRSGECVRAVLECDARAAVERGRGESSPRRSVAERVVNRRRRRRLSHRHRFQRHSRRPLALAHRTHVSQFRFCSTDVTNSYIYYTFRMMT
jgi:hypothetical protein